MLINGGLQAQLTAQPAQRRLHTYKLEEISRKYYVKELFSAIVHTRAGEVCVFMWQYAHAD